MDFLLYNVTNYDLINFYVIRSLFYCLSSLLMEVGFSNWFLKKRRRKEADGK